MTYNQFGSIGNFASNPYLQQTPSYMSTTGTPSGFKTTMQYGTRGLPPAEAAEAQKREFGRLGGIQELQAGALQQQQAGLQLRQSQMELADLEEQRRIREIIDKGPPMTSGAVSPYGSSWDYAINSPYGKRYQLEKEKTQYELDMMRRMGQGGFGSWSVPSFPSMG